MTATRTQIFGIDIKDKQIDGNKIVDNVSLAGKPQINSGSISSTASYFMILNGSDAQTLTIGRLGVGETYKTAYDNIPSGNGSAYFAGNVKIDGSLTVAGNITTVSTSQIQVSDNLIVLNYDVTSTPSENAGIEIERGTSANVKILWNETDDKWTLTNDGTDYSPIATEEYTLGNYVAKAGSELTGSLIFQRSNGIDIRSKDDDLKIWQVNPGNYGFYLLYQGTGSGNNNSLQLWADNQNSTTKKQVYGILQDGTVIWKQTATFENNITLSNGKTIDGVNLKSYKDALTGTSGTPSSTNKYVTDADSRLTNYSRIKVGSAIKSAANTTIGKTIEFINADGITLAFDTNNTDSTNRVKIGGNFVRTDLADSTDTNQTIQGNLTITKNLIVQGTKTEINTTQLSVKDNVITLNNGVTGTPSTNAGIEVERGTSNNALLQWDETNDYWIASVGNTAATSRLMDLGTSDNRYLKLTGGTLTGPLLIQGTAGDHTLRVRSIVGNSTDNSAVDDLYLQYNANKPVHFGTAGGYTISADGSSYSGNAATATKLKNKITVELTGAVTGSCNTFDGSSKLTINTTANHTHNYAGSSSAGGVATSAAKLETPRTIALSGSVTGSATFDGSTNITIATITNHTHEYLPLTGGTMTGTIQNDDVSRYWLNTNSNWGIYWNTTDDIIEYHGSGEKKTSIDLNNGNIASIGSIASDQEIKTGTNFNINDKFKLQYNLNEECIEFVFV